MLFEFAKYKDILSHYANPIFHTLYFPLFKLFSRYLNRLTKFLR